MKIMKDGFVAWTFGDLPTFKKMTASMVFGFGVK